MKKDLVYNTIVITAVVATMFMVVYNLVLRENFARIINFSTPSVHRIGEIDGFESAEEDANKPYFPLNLNNATLEELTYIPHIGDVMAERIIYRRRQLGRYVSLEQLMDVKGIGEKIYQDILPYLCLD